MTEKHMYKRPLIYISLIIGVLMIMLLVGYTVGVLSEDPDGLERSLIDANGGGEDGEAWIEELPSPWDPILGWIENDYIAGLIGISLSVIIMIGVFYSIVYLKNKNKKNLP